MDDLNTKQEVGFNNGGRLFAGSVANGAIGKGANLIIYDDLLNYETANSDVGRESAISLYQNSQTRFNDLNKKKLIIVNQRLHRNDLIGQLSEKGILKTFDRRICLPLIAQTDIVIGDKEFKKGDITLPTLFDKDIIDDMKLNLGDRKFEIQFNQNDTNDDDLVFKEKQMKFIDAEELIGRTPTLSITFIDVADDGDDFLSVPVNRYYPGIGWVCEDAFFNQGEMEKSIPRLAPFMYKYLLNEVVVEKNNGGKGFKILLEQACNTIPYYPRFILRNTTKNDKAKYIRISINSNKIMEDVTFIKNSKNKMYNDFMDQLLNYSMDSKHDDAPDSMSL
jgi:predicted phage terminase large subunit-like protein